MGPGINGLCNYDDILFRMKKKHAEMDDIYLLEREEGQNQRGVCLCTCLSDVVHDFVEHFIELRLAAGTL